MARAHSVVSFFTGVSETDIAYADNSEPLKVDNIFGLSFTLDHTDWIVQAKHTQTKLANETDTNQFLINQIHQVPSFIWPDPAPFIEKLTLDNKKIKYNSVNGQAYIGNFILTAELAQISSDSATIPKLNNGYASIAYQLNKFTFYSVYAKTTSDTYLFIEPNVNSDLIPELVNGIDSAFNYYAANQHTFSLGMRWDFNATISTYLQWNNTHIEEGGDTLWVNHYDESPSETVNTYMFNVSFAL